MKSIMVTILILFFASIVFSEEFLIRFKDGMSKRCIQYTEEDNIITFISNGKKYISRKEKIESIEKVEKPIVKIENKIKEDPKLDLSGYDPKTATMILQMKHSGEYLDVKSSQARIKYMRNVEKQGELRRQIIERKYQKEIDKLRKRNQIRSIRQYHHSGLVRTEYEDGTVEWN